MAEPTPQETAQTLKDALTKIQKEHSEFLDRHVPVKTQFERAGKVADKMLEKPEEAAKNLPQLRAHLYTGLQLLNRTAPTTYGPTPSQNKEAAKDVNEHIIPIRKAIADTGMPISPQTGSQQSTNAPVELPANLEERRKAVREQYEKHKPPEVDKSKRPVRKMPWEPTQGGPHTPPEHLPRKLPSRAPGKDK